MNPVEKPGHHKYYLKTAPLKEMLLEYKNKINVCKDVYLKENKANDNANFNCFTTFFSFKMLTTDAFMFNYFAYHDRKCTWLHKLHKSSANWVWSVYLTKHWKVIRETSKHKFWPWQHNTSGKYRLKTSQPFLKHAVGSQLILYNLLSCSLVSIDKT